MPIDTSIPFDQPLRPDRPPELVLFLDECIPREVGERLKMLLVDQPHQPKIVHLTDFYDQPGIPDESWATMVKQRGWLPLTADRGKKNFGRKLPLIMQELRVVHISLSSAVHQLKTPAKSLALVSCWTRAVHVWQNQIGCCHVLRFDEKRTAFRLVSKPPRGET